MKIFNFKIKHNTTILALGGESAGNFSIYNNGKIYFSDDFGDLLNEDNFKKFQKEMLNFLKKEKIEPKIVLSDLHPLFNTTILARELAKKFDAKYIQIQHHIAHIFSAIGEQIIPNTKYHLPAGPAYREAGKAGIPNTILAIALDGTGYGFDEKIWGGEVLAVESRLPAGPAYRETGKSPALPAGRKVESVERIGHLENQVLLGGELAIKEPMRMIISILNKFLDKDKIYKYIKNSYTKNEFNLLYSQLQQNFNCQETSSTGRILDAVSVLLGFAENKRKYKHEATKLLEKNSTEPYKDLKPKIKIIQVKKQKTRNKKQTIFNNQYSIFQSEADKSRHGGTGNQSQKKYILDTTYLFEYLIKNLHKDKKRLAATAQLYIAMGLWEIIEMLKQVQHDKMINECQIFLSGGIADNKIISSYLELKGVITNPVKSDSVGAKQFNGVPRGDAGLSFGQVVYYLLATVPSTPLNASLMQSR